MAFAALMPATELARCGINEPAPAAGPYAHKPPRPLASAILRGSDLIVNETGIRDGVRQAILPFWNAWYFLALYANAENMEGRSRTDSPQNAIDRSRSSAASRFGEGRTRQ